MGSSHVEFNGPHRVSPFRVVLMSGRRAEGADQRVRPSTMLIMPCCVRAGLFRIGP
jgi:hypothetical protein